MRMFRRAGKTTVKGKPKIGSFYSFRVTLPGVATAIHKQPWPRTETVDHGQLIDIRSNGVLIFQQDALVSDVPMAERLSKGTPANHRKTTRLIKVSRSALMHELPPAPGTTPSNPIEVDAS